MRTGVVINLGETDRQWLEALIADRNTAQKHVWRARIVLLSADGVGTNAIMAATGTSKTCVWRWQERFMTEGVGRAAARQDAAAGDPENTGRQGGGGSDA